jgi:autotransporter translocation and assembly factor TamB
LKWVFIIIALLFALLYGVLKSDRVFKEVATNLIKQSGIDLTYKELTGSPLDGLSIKGFSYEDKIKGDAKLRLNWSALGEKRLEIEDLNISNLTIDKEFLNSLLEPNKTAKKRTDSKNPIKEILIKKAHIDLKGISLKEYQIHSLNLDIRDFESDLVSSYSGDIRLNADTNAGEIQTAIDMKNSRYKATASIDPNREFLQQFLDDSNITLVQVPHIDLKTDGDLNSLEYDLLLSKGELKIKDIAVFPKNIHAKGDFGIKSGDLKMKLSSNIKSDIAELDLDSHSSLNINDLNSTFKTDAMLEIEGKKEGLRDYLKDQNISIISLSPLRVKLKASMREADIDMGLEKSVIKYKDIFAILNLQKTKLRYDLKTKELNLHSNLNLDSNITKIDSNLIASLNVADLNKTLRYNLISSAKFKKALFRGIENEQNISISKLSPLKLKIEGDTKKLRANLGLDGVVRAGELELKPTIRNSNLLFDLQSHDLNATFDLDLKSNRGDLKLTNSLKVNIDDINNSLYLKTEGYLRDAKEFRGVNLSTLGNIRLSATAVPKDFKAKIDSKLLNIDLVSVDLNRFDFDFDLKRIKLSKLYKKVPSSLQKSHLAMNGKGSYAIKDGSLSLSAKLDEFGFNGKKISTNRFTLKKSKDSLTLSPTTIKAGNFSLNLGIKQVGEEFIATIKNRAIKADALFKIDPLYIKADGKIRSLKLLKDEINKLYKIEGIPNIDGEIDFKVRSKGDAIISQIRSKKITFEEGRAEKLNIEAIYRPNRVVLKRFEFKIEGFEDKKMNRFVRLRRDGVITFNEENASIDIDIINLGKFTAKKVGDTTTAKIDIDKFYLHIPKYIKTTLSSHLKIYQSGVQKAITGTLEFKNSEVNYESRYLDVSKDSDIIIVNRKKESDDFIKNTFLDLKIYSDDEILYKVRAGEVKLKPNIIVRKEFGDTPRITGKIKILEGGEYDLADKRFHIKEGAVAFRGLKEINPLLDLHVAYEDLDEIKIFIDISGDKNRPRLKFSSKPPRSKKDIFSYLLFGMSASESEGAMSSANKAAERIFGRAVSKDLARELHLDRLDLNRNSLGGIDVKAGKKVGKKTIIYYQNKSTQSSVIVERKLSKDWDVSVEAGKEGEAIDFVYRKGFK